MAGDIKNGSRPPISVRPTPRPHGLAAREADSDEVSATPLRTSPRRDKRAKSVTQASVASSRGKTADTPSQLVAESQSLLSPAADESPTQGASLQGAPLLSVVH